MLKNFGKKIICIIQARSTSKRLPRKMLMRINGKTLLHHLVRRLAKARTIDRIIIAVPEGDAPVITEAKKIMWALRKTRPVIGFYEGSENDVLSRYLGAAESEGADIVVRVCGENIFTCNSEIDRMVRMMLKNPTTDIVHNKGVFDETKRTVPLGMGCEVMTIWALRKLDAVSRTPRHREHVVFYAFENPEQFEIRALQSPRMAVDARLTIDHLEDFFLAKDIIGAVGEAATTAEIIALIKRRPEMLTVNNKYKDDWRLKK